MNDEILQVQYAFLELPKLPTCTSDTGALQWAWLLVHAPELTEVPDDIWPGPCRQALDLANMATFTTLQLDAYQKVRDEIRQVFEIDAAHWAAGYAEGKKAALAWSKAEGKTTGLTEALLTILATRGLEVTDEQRTRIHACTDAATLHRWTGRAVTATSVDEVLAKP